MIIVNIKTPRQCGQNQQAVELLTEEISILRNALDGAYKEINKQSKIIDDLKDKASRSFAEQYLEEVETLRGALSCAFKESKDSERIVKQSLEEA